MGDSPVDFAVDLPVGEPYDAPSLFRFLAARAVAILCRHAPLAGRRLGRHDMTRQ